MGCGSSHGHDDPIPPRQLSELFTETGENDSEENNKENQKKKAALERCNNNRRTEPEPCVVNGTRIHIPDRSSEDSGLEISDLSPNQQIAEKDREHAERIRQEEESARKAKDEEGKTIAEIKGLRDALEAKIKDIKKGYDRSSVSAYDIEHAASRVRKRMKTTGHEPSSHISTTIYQDKKKELSKHQQEKARLLHKLSELASAKLRHNNANLADLSDPNRASKLAERLSELYDNEWTDVFDAVTKNANKTDAPDRAIVDSLVKILQYCYKMTRKLSTSQTQLLYEALFQGHRKTTSIHLTLHVQNLQKLTVNVSKQCFQKKIRQSVGQDLKKDAVVSRISGLMSPLPKYIDLCSELSWYMHIQSPPMKLDFDGEEFTTTRFRAYLTSGPTLSYIVWPALLLHENGPLVAKGVAEYTKSRNSITNGSNNKNGNGTESQW